MIRASTVDSRYGMASHGNVARGLSKVVVTSDLWLPSSDLIDICAFGARFSNSTAESTIKCHRQCQSALRLVNLNPVAPHCNKIPRSLSGQLGPSRRTTC